MNAFKKVISVTILNGASLSSAVDLSGYTLVGIQMPAAWTTANLTFQGAGNLTDTVLNVYDDAGVEYTVTASTNRYITIAPSKVSGIMNLKVRSGTSGTPVNQGADRVIGLVVREV